MRVAVIGSGAAGLTAIKSCKEEDLEVVCYEQSDNIGGLWRFRDEDVEGMGSVTKCTIIKTSKALSSFSDFPVPKHFPNYMHNSLIFRYFQLYAEKFQLMQYIKFHHLVESVERDENYDSNGRWKIIVTDMKTKEKHYDVVDAVMVCTGHHVYPQVPSFPGQEKFKGQIIHSHSYKVAQSFRGKRVAVVGAGNSAGDAATELSNVASKVYLSTRRGSWVMSQVEKDGTPYDDKFTTRFLNILFNAVPLSWSNWFMERDLNRKFDHSVYQLKPQHGFFQQHPMINDAIPSKILTGLITVKEHIKHFESNGIVFQGDSEVTEVDCVIFATGYKIKLPFLSKEIVNTTDNNVELYKFLYPPALKYPTLGIFGLFQSVGAVFPIDELQCRWFVQVLQKKLPFPDEKFMEKDIKENLEKIRKRYYSSARHTVQVDYITYSDELASLIGVKPNFLKMFFKDQKLFWALMFGPSLPYQYRLKGPHLWKEARQTILEYKERFYLPLKTRFRTIK